MELSVWIKWPIVGVVEVWLLMIPLLWANISCEDEETFGMCIEDMLAIPMIALSGISTLAMTWILLEWIYGQRLKAWNWIVDKWNHFNNNVVEIQVENGQPEEFQECL